MSDIQELRRQYLVDVCTALSEYVRDGCTLHIESAGAPNGVLVISFALDEGDEFQRRLRAVMGRRDSR